MSLIERWTNFKLWWKYPFIRPRTLTNDKYCSEFFKYTLLNLMPKGWTKAFGNKFCEDLNDALRTAENCGGELISFEHYVAKIRFNVL